MFLLRRKIISKGSNIYLYLPSRSSAKAFLNMTRKSRHLHEPWVYPAIDLRRYVYYLDRLKRKETIGFLIGRNLDDRLLGVININDLILGGSRSGSLGYYIDIEFAGMGYMSQALKLLLNHAFKTLALHRLEANIQPMNLASKALVKKLGFRKEGFSPKLLNINGVWCDHERWAMLDSEWKLKQENS